MLSAPKISKTWVISPNNQLIFQGRPGGWDPRVQQRSTLLLAIKNTFVALGWRVLRSCGVQKSGGPWYGDNVAHVSNGDNWTNWQHVSYDGQGTTGWPTQHAGAHAWTVLAPPAGINSNFQFILEFESEDWLAYEGSAGISFYGSSVGYDLTTGDYGYPPMALGWTGSMNPFGTGYHGEVGWRKVGWSPGYWGGAGAGNYDETVHGMASADGKQIRIFACTCGTVHWAFTMDCLDHPTPPSTSWPDPVVWSFSCSGYSTRYYNYPMGYGRFNDSAAFYTAIGGVGHGLFGVAGGYGGATLGENLGIPSEFTGKWSVQPVTLYCSDQGALGRMGTLGDTWWAQGGLVDGALLDTQDSRKLVVFNNMAFPWNTEASPLFGEYGQGS